MKPGLLISTLLVFVSVSFQAFGAGIIQDRKPPGDYMDRPAPPVPAEAGKEMDARLAEARARYESNPNDPDAIIWLGRRLSYPGRFRESIEVYSEGIKKFLATPGSTATVVIVTSPYAAPTSPLRISKKLQT